MIGQVLEKYEVLEKVGEGGMATVYKGRHRTLDREVAIKILHPHLSTNIKNRTRFEREARAIESLDCLNIPEIYDFSGPQAEHCFIITEFIHGPTLAGFLDRVERIPSEPAALIGIQVCSALMCAHRRGIIHRDIKPENIMIDETGCVKLMDFGIARVMDESHVTLTGALVGSPAFMSPEQALDREVDGRSDLFSLGTLLYMMVTSEMPFRGGNPSIVLRGIIEGRYEDPIDRTPDIHPQFARVIDRCLSTIPEERPASAEAVQDELRDVLLSSGIDPDDPENLWSLASYFHAPEDYVARLEAHLVPSLIRRGRELIEAHQPTEALRILNRVLTLDDGNAEVIHLIGRMGGEPERSPSSWWLYAALVFILGSVALGLWWQLGPRPIAVNPGDHVDRTPPVEPITFAITDAVVDTGDPVEDITESATEASEEPTEAPEEPTETPTEAREEPTEAPEEPTEVPEEPTETGEETTGDGDASADLVEEVGPEPLGVTGGVTLLTVSTPRAAGMKLYCRYEDGGPAHLLSEEAQMARPVEVKAGRIQVWVEGEFHRTRSEVITLKAGEPYEVPWFPDLKPAVVEFHGLPDGTDILLGDQSQGHYPATGRISIPAREEVRLTMRSPDGTEHTCVAEDIEPNATTTCAW